MDFRVNRHHKRRRDEYDDIFIKRELAKQRAKEEYDMHMQHINSMWRWFYSVIKNYGVQHFKELVADNRPFYMTHNLRQSLIGYGKFDEVIALLDEERREYIQAKEYIESLDIPFTVPLTTHNEQAVTLMGVIYQINARAKTITVTQRYR